MWERRCVVRCSGGCPALRSADERGVGDRARAGDGSGGRGEPELCSGVRAVCEVRGDGAAEPVLRDEERDGRSQHPGASDRAATADALHIRGNGELCEGGVEDGWEGKEMMCFLRTNKRRMLRFHVALQGVLSLCRKSTPTVRTLVVLLARVRVDMHLQIARVVAREVASLKRTLVRLLARVRQDVRRQRSLRARRVVTPLVRALERLLARVHHHMPLQRVQVLRRVRAVLVRTLERTLFGVAAQVNAHVRSGRGRECASLDGALERALRRMNHLVRLQCAFRLC